MRKLLTVLMIMILFPALAACGSSDADTVTEWTVRQMAESIWNSQESSEKMTLILPEDELYETYLTDSYGLDTEEIADGAILAAEGTLAREIAVLCLTEETSAEEAADTLRTYLENRTGAFTGYFPEEAALLANAEVDTRGSYIALMVCEDMTAAEESFERCFTEEAPEEPERWPEQTAEEASAPENSAEPSGEALTEEGSEEEIRIQPTEESQTDTDTMAASEASEPQSSEEPEESIPTAQPEETVTDSEPEETEQASEAAEQDEELPEEASWSYQEARLLEAWNLGDWSGLAPEDQAILDVCAEVIETVATEDLSDYEKELAVHDWMIARGDYDSDTLSQLPGFTEDPNNDNPYGFLINGRGICLGYASTFQLFMDLLGIECITVEGTAYNGTSDHAWNQIRLDGEWYCVDVTWDDPVTSGRVSEQTAHRYFNVTSDFMRETSHQWNEAEVPEADGTAYAWR